MSEWRAGKFHRKDHGFWSRFTPVESVHSLLDVTPEELIEAGKKLVLVDVDNTLVEWRSETIPKTTLAWLTLMKASGLSLCIISNTRKVERLRRLAGTLDIPFLVGRFKPSRSMYKRALEQFGAKPEEAVMIGDQIFTDVWGANRSGIDAIWVKQMAPKDFVGTKISRFGEKIVRRRLYHKMDKMERAKSLDSENTELEGGPDEAEDDLAAGGSAAFELLRNPVVRQFIKFCIVGGSSTVIDLGLLWFLAFHAKTGDRMLSDVVGSYLMNSSPTVFSFANKPLDAAVPIFKIVTSSLAIVNAFIWNRRWTFKIRGKEHRSVQLQKFFAVALIGMVLNTLITTGFNTIIAGHPGKSLAIASAIATVVVAFWNFFGQKYWTFKHKH